MQKYFESKKIIAFYKRNKKNLLYFAILSFVFLVVFSIYSILNVREDAVINSQGQKKTNEANINFDKNYLQGLENKKSPTTVNKEGGRNPFLNF